VSTTIKNAMGNLNLPSNMKDRKRARRGLDDNSPHDDGSHAGGERYVPRRSTRNEAAGPATPADFQPVSDDRIDMADGDTRHRTYRDLRDYYAVAKDKGHKPDADYHSRRKKNVADIDRVRNPGIGRLEAVDSRQTPQVGGDVHPKPYASYEERMRSAAPGARQANPGVDARVEQPQPYLPENVAPFTHNRAKRSSRPSKSSVGKMLRLPEKRMREKGMITLDQPRSMLAEQYRAIRMTLMNNARRPSADGLRPRSNLLMVTSALAGEGKTYTSINLALSISMEPDTTVLLVDADSSKGSLSSVLGVPKGTPGLMDVLMEDGLHIEDVILKTDAPRFSIIPRGTPNEFATDLFSGSKMQQLLFELSVRYDNRIVMLDTSPLLMTTEARALANTIDQIPFVVGAENTTHGSLEESLSYLSPDKYVGMILNMATRQTRSKYGYYHDT